MAKFAAWVRKKPARFSGRDAQLKGNSRCSLGKGDPGFSFREKASYPAANAVRYTAQPPKGIGMKNSGNDDGTGREATFGDPNGLVIESHRAQSEEVLL